MTTPASSAAPTPATGYLRFPAIHGDRIVFVAEDDLWTVSASGGEARRLTAGVGFCAFPYISPDGAWIAYLGKEEGVFDVYLVPSEGGEPRRLTYMGGSTRPCGWTPDGAVLISSTAYSPGILRVPELYQMHPATDPLPVKLPYGYGNDLAVDGAGRMILGRFTTDNARWKRYRGGTRGTLWIDAAGSGQFAHVHPLDGNLASPMWVGDRVFCLSDHEGYSNLYSFAPDGSDVKRHTDHEGVYARFARTDGQRIVYQHGGEIWLWDAESDAGRPVAISVHGPRPQRQKKWAPAVKHLDDYALHPSGHSLAVNARGRAFTMPLWEQAPHQLGDASGAKRYRLTTYLHDGESTVSVVADDLAGASHEVLEIHSTTDPLADPTRITELDFGIASEIAVHPTKKIIAIANTRFQLHLIDLETKTIKQIDESKAERIGEPAFSADGRWLAYGYPCGLSSRRIHVYDCEQQQVHRITDGSFQDESPAWDPEGKYLYFLSYRTFDPVYLHYFFELGFPEGSKPYAVPLKPDTKSPFENEPKGFGDKDDDDDEDGDDDSGSSDDKPGAGSEGSAGGEDDKGKKDDKKSKEPKPVEIDFTAIGQRILPFPVAEGLYEQIHAIKGKVLYTVAAPEGALGLDDDEPDDTGKADLRCWDFEDDEEKTLVEGVYEFDVAADNATLLYRTGKKLRVIKAGEEPPKENEQSRKGGWLDLSRLRIEINPKIEWRQMAREAWRLMRDHFWVADMSGHDWDAMWQRYEPLLDRLATRSDFSDFMWELQGELGTSHAYEFMGDYPIQPMHRRSQLATLGADVEWDAANQRYNVAGIVAGDSWDPEDAPPFWRPGHQVQQGETILAVAGRRVDAQTPPQQLLANQGGDEVAIVVGDANGANPRTVYVEPLAGDGGVRYREWVERNRRIVHEATNGAVGYLHVPNMGADGYAEFHRGYLREWQRDALIVDVRFNGGGHVSQTLLEKLARKRIGYDQRRYGIAQPYPTDSPMGPIVAITNEAAGSDGDIFSHCFKLMNLGPLVGVRTWGGVIGIWPRHALVDGAITTQPEFSFWFQDVGWGVENYGTDPTHQVEIAPHDFAAGRDPQMDKALELIRASMQANPPRVPDFGPRPNLRPNPLPPRS